MSNNVKTSQEMHACMGLNACKGQGNAYDNPSFENECAGQGYCATTAPHSCHVQNDCKNQGGCGLYGTAEEQNEPGANCCAGMGSCATPMAAERFCTDGPNQGKSVWNRAREVFVMDKRWKEVLEYAAEHNPTAYEKLKDMSFEERARLAPAQGNNAPSFENGPPTAWLNTVVDGYAACGTSGMSGNSCA